MQVAATAVALGQPCVAPCHRQALQASRGSRVQQVLLSPRAPCPAPRRRLVASPSAPLFRPAAEQSEKGVAAVGSDLNWAHVARDVKARLADMMGSKEGKADHLQAWLSEAKLTSTGESDVEHNQTEMVAAQEAEYQGLAGMKPDVRAWLRSGGEPVEGEADQKMVGLLTVRLLQAYHEGAGEPFDDENEDCYWRLQGFIPGGLVEALDHELLKRLVKAYCALPFSGV